MKNKTKGGSWYGGDIIFNDIIKFDIDEL